MSTPFTETERDILLKEYESVKDTLRSLQGKSGDDPQKVQAEIGKLIRRKQQIWDEYREKLPRIPVSRCPFTGQVVLHSLDPYGIDGLWWNYEGSDRPAFEDVPETFCAITGALTLQQEIEKTSFLVKPGPEVPYVIPRLLENETVKAVLSSLKVGRHTAFVIVYFTEFPLKGVKWPNHWGLSYYSSGTSGADFRWYETYDNEDTLDFDLKPWIRNGKLQWISFKDDAMVLHSSITSCPYLDLPGKREILRIQSGKWWV
jgi:hypothetical protein